MADPVYRIIEIAILATTLVATVLIAAMVWRQTRKHFQLEHSRSFIERFNSAEMVAIRRQVDAWLARGESPADLNARIAAGDEDATATSAALRTLTNFFQELGVAHKRGAVQRDYVWDVFGALSSRYWWALESYVNATRERLGRPTLHQDFESFASEMKREDEVRRVVTTAAPPAGAPTAWVFGYGSLFNPDSIEEDLAEPLDRTRLRIAWLNGYRRAWTVWDEVEFDGDPPRRVPLAFLGLMPDPGARCNGVLFPVTRGDLERLDARERCYRRVEVTEAVDANPGAPVYTYLGRPEYAEFPPGTRIGARYLEALDAGLEYWGPDFRANYDASTRGAADLEPVRGTYEFTPETPAPVSC